MTNPPDWKQDQAEASRLPREGRESAQAMLADYEKRALQIIKLATEQAEEIRALRAASAPAAVRDALDRLHRAVRSLGRIGKNNGTLFEDSPLKSQEAYNAWTELNGAQRDASLALGFKLLFDNEWLEAKIKSDPDIENDAGSALATPEEASTAVETEEQFEERLLKQESGENLRLLDYIADKIGLPHNEELSRENFGAWFAWEAVAWRSIDTAPKDGTRLILAWDDIAALPMHWEVGRYRSGTGPGSGWCNTYGHPFSGAPTHWTIPPKSSAASAPPAAQTDGVREALEPFVKPMSRMAAAKMIDPTLGPMTPIDVVVTKHQFASAQIALSVTRPGSGDVA